MRVQNYEKYFIYAIALAFFPKKRYDKTAFLWSKTITEQICVGDNGPFENAYLMNGGGPGGVPPGRPG